MNAGEGGITLADGRRRGPFALCMALAVATMLADQASKLWLLFGTDLPWTYPWRVLGFLDLTMVWNRGISYGLFPQESEVGRYMLIALKLIAATVFTTWMWRSRSWPEAVGLALIIGGAIGNAVDRTVHGAVFDFVHLHYAGWSWYVFNLADAAVVVGVAFLLYSYGIKRHAA